MWTAIFCLGIDNMIAHLRSNKKADNFFKGHWRLDNYKLHNKLHGYRNYFKLVIKIKIVV